MTQLLRKTALSHWPEELRALPSPSTMGAGATQGFRPPRSASESKAEETTRVAREIMDAMTEQRHSKTARLRQARLEREESARALAEAEPPKKARRAR